MVKRLPFYMVYDMEENRGNMSMQMPWLGEEHMFCRDYEYMKSTYPDMVKRIMPYVEEECDRMEYSGSMMFDEYPDQLQVRMMCRRSFNKFLKDNSRERNENDDSDQWIRDLIWVLMWQEILRRRSDYRKYRRKFY